MTLMYKLRRVMTLFIPFYFLLISLSTRTVDGLWCDRTPAGVNDPKTPGDNGYKILISGESEKYIPGAVYTVRVVGEGNQFTVEKFVGFLLVVEPGDGQSPESSAGSFQLTPDSLARFSEYCPHAVKHASELPKAEVSVRWTAPVSSSAGCVVFRATVIKNKGSWFMDDGALTKQLCPENDYGLDENENYEPCCACDEAKYELTFEGLWSSLTHPKDFPADTLSAHFSDIIGASHSPNFRFWDYGGTASDGLKHIAETGDPKELESELKDRSGNIRTIIKARGLKNPNFYGHKTFAVFRADRDHNLISLVSKIDPSPDWFVGISGMNLCLPNCTWAMSKAVNLFPWDAGTNNGVSYAPSGDMSIPRERISRIVWTNNENSPFFDPSGGMVKPFAKLRLVKQRSYDRACDLDPRKTGTSLSQAGPERTEGEDLDMYDDSDHQHKPECQVTLYTEWSPCSVTCGQGTQTRSRQYVNTNKASDYGCKRKLIDKKNCYNPNSCRRGSSYGPSGQNYYSGGSNSRTSSSGSEYGRGHREGSRKNTNNNNNNNNNNNSPCETTSWTPWSMCSSSCGRGRRTRERQYVNARGASDYKCNKVLQDHDSCMGSSPDCSSSSAEQVESGCETTSWSEWGPCSVSCKGTKGTRVRTRLFVNPRVSHHKCNLDLTQYSSCEGARGDCSSSEDMKEICKLPKQVGMCPNDGNLTRFYFDVERMSCQKFIFHPCKGNQNNFLTEKDCQRACSVLRENLLSDSAAGRYQSPGLDRYGNHNSNNNNNNNNNWPSYEPYDNHNYNHHPVDSTTTSQQSGPDVDCVVSEWGEWSRCSTTCGRGHKSRSRYIKVFSQNGGRDCPPLKQQRRCKDYTCEPSHPYRYVSMDSYNE